MRIRSVATLLVLSLGLAAGARALAPRAAAGKAESFIDTLLKGNFASPQKNFTTTMKQAVPPGKLAKVWRNETQSLGPFERFSETKVVDYQGYTIAFVKTAFKEGPLWIKVVFDQSGRIAGLFFVPAPASG